MKKAKDMDLEKLICPTEIFTKEITPEERDMEKLVVQSESYRIVGELYFWYSFPKIP